jgi:hypothetical protein
VMRGRHELVADGRLVRSQAPATADDARGFRPWEAGAVLTTRSLGEGIVDRKTLAAIVATAALSSGATAAAVQFAAPNSADAQSGSQTAVLRQINRNLTMLNSTVGENDFEGLRSEVHKLRRDQREFCRSISPSPPTCPLAL